MQIMLKNYKRLVYIDTGVADQETYREVARKTAKHFSLNFEEVQGSNALVKKLLLGPWDHEILVVTPGETIKFADFKDS
jgi:hypothetical protein